MERGEVAVICKNCGTQFTGAYCSHCGHKGESEVYQPPAPPAEVTVKPVAKGAEKNKKKRTKARGSRRPIRFKMVFWQAIVMLSPLAYFFIDLFIQLQKSLCEVVDGGKTGLSLLFSYLASPEYSDNTVSDIVKSLIGDNALLERISARTLFTGGGSELMLPLLVTLAFALLSAVMAMLLLITGGRILHAPFAVDLCILGGVGATFAPLLSTLLMRVSFFFAGGAAAADAAMLCVTPSVQSILLMLLLAAVLLPATRSIAKLGAYLKREEHYVVLPFRLVKRASFNLVRAFAGAAMALSLLLVLSYLFLPVTSEGDLLAFAGAWKSFSADLTALCKSIWAIISGGATTPDFAALASMLIKFFFFLQIPFLVVGFIVVLATFIRLWRMRPDTLCDRKNDRARLTKIGGRIRHIVLRPFKTFVTLQAILFFLLLFLSPVATHLDFSNIEETLSVLYLTLASVKAFCGTTTVYAFLALLGALLWHTAGKLSRLLMIKADEK